MKIGTVIFDVDGTLWDSTEKVALSWNETCRERGYAFDHITPERLTREFGKTLPDIGYSLFPELPKDEALALTDACCRLENIYLRKDPPAAYNGVEALFRTLRERGLRIAIVSNCECGYIETMLEVTGLAHLTDAHLCAGDTGVGKAETMRMTIERFGLTDPVYVGDTAGDERATREVGIPFIHAAYGFGEAVSPDAVIRVPMELPAVLASLEGSPADSDSADL